MQEIKRCPFSEKKVRPFLRQMSLYSLASILSCLTQSRQVSVLSDEMMYTLRPGRGFVYSFSLGPPRLKLVPVTVSATSATYLPLQWPHIRQ